MFEARAEYLRLVKFKSNTDRLKHTLKNLSALRKESLEEMKVLLLEDK